jgi:hypothetical protein
MDFYCCVCLILYEAKKQECLIEKSYLPEHKFHFQNNPVGFYNIKGGSTQISCKENLMLVIIGITDPEY